MWILVAPHPHFRWCHIILPWRKGILPIPKSTTRFLLSFSFHVLFLSMIALVSFLLFPFMGKVYHYDEGWNVALWGRRGITRGSLELLLFKVGVYNGTYCDVVWEGE
jgi:hypothetical protein